MTSAAFSIDGTTVPRSNGNAIETTHGATVNLALLSTVGADTITWTIAGLSSPDAIAPTITKSGTPLGSTASFVMPAELVDDVGGGLSVGVKCRVQDGNGTRYESFGVVGVPTIGGAVPVVAGEDNHWRHETVGWTTIVNQSLLGFPYGAVSSTSTGSTPTTALTVLIPPGKIAVIDSVWSAYDTVSEQRLIRQSSMVVKNNIAGTSASQVGSDVDMINVADDLTWSSTFQVSGSSVNIRYAGDASNATTWRIYVWRTLLGN